jgi:hypothetical protein
LLLLEKNVGEESTQIPPFSTIFGYPTQFGALPPPSMATRVSPKTILKIIPPPRLVILQKKNATATNFDPKNHLKGIFFFFIFFCIFLPAQFFFMEKLSASHGSPALVLQLNVVTRKAKLPFSDFGVKITVVGKIVGRIGVAMKFLSDLKKIPEKVKDYGKSQNWGVSRARPMVFKP